MSIQSNRKDVMMVSKKVGGVVADKVRESLQKASNAKSIEYPAFARNIQP